MKLFSFVKPLALTLVMSPFVISTAQADDAVAYGNANFNYSDKSLQEKAIKISDPRRDSNNRVSAKPQIVKLNVKPSKPSYRVNERMNFMVTGDKDYYLYVFNIDPVTNKSTMLIPNANTKDHHLQAGKRYNIPGTVDFYADRPGTEHLVFVGSNKPLPLKQSNFQQMGEFSVADSKSIDQAIQQYSLDPKAVLVGNPSHRNNRQANQAQPSVVTLKIY